MQDDELLLGHSIRTVRLRCQLLSWRHTNYFAGSRSLRITLSSGVPALLRNETVSKLVSTALNSSPDYGARNASCCWTFLHLGKCPYFYSSTFLLPPASWTLLISHHAELRLFFVSFSDWVGLQRPSEVHLPLLLVSLARFDFSLSLTVPVCYLWYSSSVSELSSWTF